MSSIKVSVTGLLLSVMLLPSIGEAQTLVTCGASGALQAAIDASGVGATLLVSGTCNENIQIGTGNTRMTLDGQGTAVINGPDTATANVRITSRGITIQGFTITGGRHGIQVIRGGTALIDGNIIQNTGGNGIFVVENSTARIINNTIQNNLGGDGVQASENSSIRVGFLAGTDTVASPNIIQGNGVRGITVTRSSNARIVGNTISNNTSEGIRVRRDSQADISSNTINGNGSNGVTVESNSGVNLGADTGTSIFESPNSTTVNNSGAGVRCFINSYADGRQGSLTGTSGATSFSGDCINSLVP